MISLKKCGRLKVVLILKYQYMSHNPETFGKNNDPIKRKETPEEQTKEKQDAEKAKEQKKNPEQEAKKSLEDISNLSRSAIPLNSGNNE